MSQPPTSSKGSKKSVAPKGSLDPKPSAIPKPSGTAPGGKDTNPGGTAHPYAGSAPGGVAKKGPIDPTLKPTSGVAKKATSDTGKNPPGSMIPKPAPDVARPPSKQSSIASLRSTDDENAQGKGRKVPRPLPPPAVTYATGSFRSKDLRTGKAPIAERPAGPGPAGGRPKFMIGARTASETEYEYTPSTNLHEVEELYQEAAANQGKATAGIQRDQRLKALPTASHSDEILGREQHISVLSRPSTRAMAEVVRYLTESPTEHSSARSSSGNASEINLDPHFKSAMSEYATEDPDDPIARPLRGAPHQGPVPDTYVPTPYVPIEGRSGKSGSRQTTGSSGKSYRSAISGQDRFEGYGRETTVSRPATPVSPVKLKKVTIPAVGKPITKTASEMMAEELKDYRQMMTQAIQCARQFSGEGGWREKGRSTNNFHLPKPAGYPDAYEFAQRLVNKVYRFELVLEYDRYVTETRAGAEHSHLKRLAEDDALYQAAQPIAKERYPDWQELQGFFKWLETREYGIWRQKIADLMAKNNWTEAEARRQLEGKTTINLLGYNAR